MTGIRKGEVRRAPKWHYVGHEATGDRPSLVISPDWFNDDGFAIIAPLTTPNPNHGYWWEPHISSTDSVCLVPDARTVPVRDLGRSVEGHATPNEMDDVLSAFDHLTNGREEMSDGSCNRGEVWEANFSDRAEQGDKRIVEVLILHYNSANCMAMTSIVSNRKRNPSPLVVGFHSSPRLRGRSALLGQVRAIATEHRLESRIGTVPRGEMDEATNKLRKFLKPPAPTTIPVSG